MPPAPASAAVKALGLRLSGAAGGGGRARQGCRGREGLVARGFSSRRDRHRHPKAQPGNEQPRAWRELDVRGLRNRMGFNNEGADAAARRLATLDGPRGWARRPMVGVNIGKNKVTTADDAPLDYGYCARVLAPYADYLVVNVSSPNTPGLRDLAVRRGAASDSWSTRAPVLTRGCRSRGAAAREDRARSCRRGHRRRCGPRRRPGAGRHCRYQHHDSVTIGGQADCRGRRCLARSVDVIARLRVRVGRTMCLIGVGGISTAEDAQAMLDAGATLVQGYTALVYQGPDSGRRASTGSWRGGNALARAQPRGDQHAERAHCRERPAERQQRDTERRRAP